MFRRVLVANRGEIALRVIRACDELNVETVAVYSTADADCLHVRRATAKVCIGPPDARRSYLSIPSIIAAAKNSGCDAIHPGYGFLAENATFAEACAENGLVFIGPSPDSIPAPRRQISGEGHDGGGGTAGRARKRRGRLRFE